MKKHCPICKSKNIFLFLNREQIPTHQNYLSETYEKAINTKFGNLKLCFCDDCGFVFNSDFDINKLDYGINYDNTQDVSEIFKQYLDEEIDFFSEKYDLKDKVVVEVGCGKGFFLKRLVERTNCKAIGFDPSYIGNEIINDNLKFIKDFYSEKYNDIKADFIICRHVIEHIENPLNILAEIYKAISKSEDAVVFFETPSVKWILENNIIYDFFYEHCSYFDDESITRAMNTVGFKVNQVLKMFSGQYMWIIAERSGEKNTILKANITKLKELSIAYGDKLNSDIEKMKIALQNLNTSCKVAIWGAGAKGNTFVNLLDKERLFVEAVVDINENKQGGFILGTGHEIIAPADILNRRIGCIIIMNSNYFDEIEKYLEDKDIKVKLMRGEDLI